MEINEIKTRLTIFAVLSHYSLKQDKNNMLRCPFHPDETASMKIYPETGTFHCFGCGANGDVIEFIQRKEETTKHKALLKASELVGESQPTNISPKPKNNTQTDHKDESTEALAKVEILTKIFTYFQNGLHSGVAKRPKDYLAGRSLNPESLELGYNSGQFHHRGKLNEKDTQACKEAGLLIPYNGSVPNASGTSYRALPRTASSFL